MEGYPLDSFGLRDDRIALLGLKGIAIANLRPNLQIVIFAPIDGWAKENPISPIDRYQSNSAG